MHNYSLDSDIKTKIVWILTIISVILIFIIGIVTNMFGITFIPLQINLENIIKIEALNSDMVIIKDRIYEETYNYYDNLFRENIEFWNRLDRVVLDSE